MAYEDLNDIFTPAFEESPPFEWGVQIRTNFEWLIDPPRCSVFTTTAYSIASGSFQAASFTDQRYDVGGLHSTVTNPTRIMIPAGADGLWVFAYTLQYNANSSGNRLSRLRINGSTHPNNGNVNLAPLSVSSVSNAATGYAELELSGGDYVEVGAQTNGGSDTREVIGAYLTARWVARLAA